MPLGLAAKCNLFDLFVGPQPLINHVPGPPCILGQLFPSSRPKGLVDLPPPAQNIQLGAPIALLVGVPIDPLAFDAPIISNVSIRELAMKTTGRGPKLYLVMGKEPCFGINRSFAFGTMGAPY